MTGFAEGWFEATGGLRLFYRDYDGAPAGRTPVLCLPGLTRSSRDFAALAEALAPERRVVCPDMRGRGRSAHDPDARNYNALVEAEDAAALLDSVGIARAVFVGTSRGGVLTMLAAVKRPELVAGAVLNDIGPVIDAAGLRRIASGFYASAPLDGWDAAVAAQRASHEAQFPKLTAEQWERFARATYVEVEGRPRRDFDSRIMHGVAAALEGPAPDLWGAFEALAGRPVLAIRGANSDILSEATLAEMNRRLPDLRTLALADRGHCPFLDEPEALEAIRDLLTEVDEE